MEEEDFERRKGVKGCSERKENTTRKEFHKIVAMKC